jgi:hypothetical protein
MPSMLILMEFPHFLFMHFLRSCWRKAFAKATFTQIYSHILHELLPPKKAQNEHARQCPQTIDDLVISIFWLIIIDRLPHALQNISSNLGNSLSLIASTVYGLWALPTLPATYYYFWDSHIFGMTLIMKQNVSNDPLHVGFFCAVEIMLEADYVSNLI